MNLAFERINSCIICDENDWAKFQNVIRLNVSFNLEICTKCGYVSQNPALSEDYLKNYYLDNYVINNYEGTYEKIYNESLLPAKARIKYLTDNDLITNIARTLEIGPGAGAMINLLLEKGAEVTVIEPDNNAAIWLKNFDAIIYNGFFNDIYRLKRLKWVKNPFDCIILIHILEHIKNPLEFLKKLHTILKKKGLIVVEVPNIKRPYSDEYCWKAFCDPGHLHYFSKNSLFNILCKSGFDVISITDNIFEPYGNVFCVAEKVDYHNSLHYMNKYDNVSDIKKIWHVYVRYHKMKLFIYKCMKKCKKIFNNLV